MVPSGQVIPSGQVVALVTLNFTGTTRVVVEVFCPEPLARLEMVERFLGVISVLQSGQPFLQKLLEQQGFALRVASPEQVLF